MATPIPSRRAGRQQAAGRPVAVDGRPLPGRGQRDRRLRLAADRRRACAQRPAQRRWRRCRPWRPTARSRWCAPSTATCAHQAAAGHRRAEPAGPMVDTADQARALVSATRYPPQGIRGVGSAVGRASRWSARTDYLDIADDEVCLLVQAETVSALRNLEAICAVDGIDGVFIGPADLAASMGHRGKSRPSRGAGGDRGGDAHHRRVGQGGGHADVGQRWRGATWNWAAPSSPWASTCCSMRTRRASWPRTFSVRPQALLLLRRSMRRRAEPTEPWTHRHRRP
jgi:hypothetical protein